MAYLSLSTRDSNVLEKMKDPESDPARNIVVDGSLPKDPHCTNLDEYGRVAAEERGIILAVQQAELQLAGLKSQSEADPLNTYRECVAKLGEVISTHPKYASARNNRAQANRRLYGDGMLVANAQILIVKPLIHIPDQLDRISASSQTLSDLDTCISLLSPSGPYPRLSPQAAKTLSSAHTQRAAIYHQTSKLLAAGVLDLDSARREASWTHLEFEEAASRDFAMGGRFGNEIAKGLAVSTNPTAKLCGQIVRQAMKDEYGPGFGE